MKETNNEKSNVKKPRIEYIDLAKGFCICLVVFHHYCYQYTDMDSTINLALISFRMPLYFILSGLFFKDYGSFFNFTIQKTNKILIPFLAFAGLNALLIAIVHLFKGKGIDTEPIFSLYYEQVPNYPTWFLWCLFINGIIFYAIYAISKLFGKYMAAAILANSLIIGIIGFYLGKNSINLPMYLDTALTVTPFYAFGYILRKHTQFLYPNKSDKYIIPISIACAAYILLCANKQEFVYNRMENANIFSMYSCGLIGTIGILYISKLIKKLPIISYLGRYSIIILCTHVLFYLFIFQHVIKYCYVNWNIPQLYTSIGCFFAEILISLLIIPLMIRYMPYICAQKDLIKYNK